MLDIRKLFAHQVAKKQKVENASEADKDKSLIKLNVDKEFSRNSAAYIQCHQTAHKVA